MSDKNISPELVKELDNIKSYISTDSHMMIEVMVRLSALESIITGEKGLCTEEELREEVGAKFSLLYKNMIESNDSQLNLPLYDGKENENE